MREWVGVVAVICWAALAVSMGGAGEKGERDDRGEGDL
jgi:hypothetical protein